MVVRCHPESPGKAFPGLSPPKQACASPQAFTPHVSTHSSLLYDAPMSGLFAGTPLERPVTCEVCGKPLDVCTCPRDASGRVLLPKDQTASIRREKRRKGKVVTTIAGLDPSASDLIAILRKLKSACAAGGTINDDVIEIQGDHRAKVGTVLEQRGFMIRVE